MEESKDLMLKNANKGEKMENTMLQQYLAKQDKLSFATIVSLMSEFLLASFDTVCIL